MHKLLTGHQCRTAQQCGWGGIKNGELLKQAESEFDLFITSDQNIRYQQNLAGRRIPILEQLFVTLIQYERVRNSPVRRKKLLLKLVEGLFRIQ